MRGTSRRADLALVGAVLVWGSTFVIVKEALENVSTLLFLALRFGLATLALRLTVRRPLTWRSARAGLLAGAALFSGFFFQTLGLRYTTPSKSAFITGLSVVLVPLISSLIQRRLPSATEAGGVLTATIGMALLTLDPQSLQMGYGDFLTLMCAIAFAIHIVLVGYLVHTAGAAELTFVQVATSAVLAASGFWWLETPFIRWTPALIGAIAGTGLLATALAFSVQSWAQQFTSPTRTALIFALEPVIAAGASFLLIGEVLPARGVFGAVLILAGILAVELRKQ